MLRQMPLPRNPLESVEPSLREPSGDASVLVNDTQIGQSPTGLSQMSNVADLVSQRRWWDGEAFLGEISSPVKVYELVRVRFDLV